MKRFKRLTLACQRHLRSFRATVLVIIILAAGIGGCSSEPHPTAVQSVKIAVSPSRPLRVTVPGIATVTAPIGSFRGRGTIRIIPLQVPLPYGGSLSAAGAGIDVSFSGVTLSRPLTIAFDVTAKPGKQDVPVVVHRLAGGAWGLSVASTRAGRMTVQARTFSPRIPAWLNPGAWMHWLGNRLASVIGGRTPPINCAGGGPTWASVSKQTDEAHTCLISSQDHASHAIRAEVQIKSNRGVALEVDIPPGSDYTWVQDQSWAIRSWVWAHIIHQNPNLMALLPQGATLTAGYRRPTANEDLSFQVQVSYWSLTFSLISDIVDALLDAGADRAGMTLTDLYLLTKCSGAISPGTLSVHNPLSTATFGSALTCVINEAASNLASPRKALGAARSLLGPGVYQADLDTATNELTSVGGKLLTFGWVVKLWPILQLGWGGTADVVHNLLSGGASAVIGLHLRAADASQGPIVYVPCCGIPGRDQNPHANRAEDYRPQTWYEDATGSHVLKNATWQVWNATEAIGIGTAAINSCEPACTGGRYYEDPAIVTLSEPQECNGSWFWSKAVWHFPKGIPPGETQDQASTILFAC